MQISRRPYWCRIGDYIGVYHSYVVQVVVSDRIMKIYSENHDKIIAILLKNVAVSFKYFMFI